MKKRRFFKIICCFCLLLCSTFFLTACTGGGSGGSGSSSGYDSDNPPKPDPDKQPPSSGDDSDIDIDDDGNIGGNGQVADFSDYFYGYMGMIKGNDDFEVQDEATGSKVKFNALLDRQFDVLAQDVLYRLNYIYGTNGTDRLMASSEDRIGYKNLNDVITNNVYKYGNNVAVVNDEVIATLIDKNHSHQYGNFNLKCIECYQAYLNLYDSTKSNYLYNTNFMNFSGAIIGNNMNLNLIQLIPDNTKSWNWSVTENNTFKFVETYRNDFKMAICQIVSGITPDGKYDENSYNKLLNNIDYLGYVEKINNAKGEKVNFADEIISFVYDTIIDGNRTGNNSLILRDKKIFENSEYLNSVDCMYTITDSFMMSAPNPGNSNYSENENQNSPRLYKGYNIIIPAIVNQALNNTFESTKTSLYPYYARSSSKNGDFETRKIINSSGEVVEEMTTTGPITLDKIILKPKANSQPVALQLQIATARKLNNGEQSDDINDLGCYAHDIVVELEVNITYKATYYTNENGVQVAHPYILNMPTYVPDGEDSGVLTIDSKGYIPTYIDTNDPNYDPTKVTFDPNNPHAKDPYSESFRKPYDTNGEILPFNYVFSIYDNYTDDTPKMGAYNGPSDASSMTLFNNGYKSDDSSVYLDSGDNYIQFTFNIKSVKKYSGDNSTQLVDASEYKNDVVFDISLMPFTF